MKTKLRFLFVLLTMLWWGANFAWATDTKTFTSGNAPLVGSTETIGNITVTYGNSSSVYTGGTFTFNSTEYYGLQAHKTESSDLSNIDSRFVKAGNEGVINYIKDFLCR